MGFAVGPRGLRRQRKIRGRRSSEFGTSPLRNPLSSKGWARGQRTLNSGRMKEIPPGQTTPHPGPEPHSRPWMENASTGNSLCPCSDLPAALLQSWGISAGWPLGEGRDLDNGHLWLS